MKKIKQSSIRKWSKDATQINFGAKNVSSVKNAGTSRVSYSKIFYANKSKSSLKNYTKVSKSSIPKKMIWRESNSSTQIRYLMKNRENLTNSHRNINSEHKIHKSSESPMEQNNNDQPESNIVVLKNKLVKTISNQQILQQKTKNDNIPSKNEIENKILRNQEASCFEIRNDSTESEKTNSDSEDELAYQERSIHKKEKKIRKMI